MKITAQTQKPRHQMPSLRIAWVTGLLAVLSLANSPSQSLALSDHAALAGGVVQVPITVAQPAGLVSAYFQLNYDPAILNLETATNGDLGQAYHAKLHSIPGTLRVAAVLNGSPPTGQSNLVLLRFRVNSGAQPGQFSALTLADQRTHGLGGKEITLSNSTSFAGGSVKVVAATTDSNTNGLPDCWEEMYFGGPTKADPRADEDDDGMTNFSEFQAGTDPRNSSSLLRLQVARIGDSEWQISFRSVLGKSYQLESSSDFTVWQQRGPIIPGTDDSIAILDATSGAQTAQYYRIRLLSN